MLEIADAVMADKTLRFMLQMFAARQWIRTIICITLDVCGRARVTQSFLSASFKNWIDLHHNTGTIVDESTIVVRDATSRHEMCNDIKMTIKVCDKLYITFFKTSSCEDFERTFASAWHGYD